MLRLLALIAIAAAAALAHASEDPRLERSRAASATLGNQLKAALTQAMQEGGPLAAVRVCNTRAPAIADATSRDGMLVGRTALRVRNPSNAPTPAQWDVLKRFATRFPLAAGTPPPEHFAVAADGSAEYLRAIPMGALCQTCHGQALPAELANTIQTLYPDDQATGFTPGELRGAFVVSWPANPEFSE